MQQGMSTARSIFLWEMFQDNSPHNTSEAPTGPSYAFPEGQTKNVPRQRRNSLTQNATSCARTTKNISLFHLNIFLDSQKLNTYSDLTRCVTMAKNSNNTNHFYYVLGDKMNAANLDFAHIAIIADDVVMYVEIDELVVDIEEE